jgi:2-oxoglutarate ferredoxin oxidoreductase subunit alpha
MMEPVTFRDEEPIETVEKNWAVSGTEGKRSHHTVQSIYIEADDLEAVNNRLQAKYAVIRQNEVRVELLNCDQAEIILTAFGTCSRICRNIIRQAAEIGIKVGLIRPITLWPFPEAAVAAVAQQPSVKAFLDVELNSGQMLEDVRLAVNGCKPVHFHGRTGGNLPTQQEIRDKIRAIATAIAEDGK